MFFNKKTLNHSIPFRLNMYILLKLVLAVLAVSQEKKEVYLLTMKECYYYVFTILFSDRLYKIRSKMETLM